MRVLIIKLSALGDIVHALPTANAIYKQHEGNVELDWLVYDKFAAVLEGQKSINKIYSVSKERFFSSILDLIFQLRHRQYDLVIDLQGHLKTGLLGYLFNGDKFIGFEEPRENIANVFYSEKVDAGEVLSNESHVIEKSMKVAEYLGAGFDVDYGLDLGSLSGEKTKATNKVCIIPSTTWESKLWSSEYWADTIEALITERKSKIFILGTSADKEVINPIVSELGSRDLELLESVVVVDDLKIPQLPEFFSGMNQIIGVDTGPLHIAAAVFRTLGRDHNSIIGLYGPTSAARTGPYGFSALSYDVLRGKPATHKRTILEDAGSMRFIKPEILLEKLLPLTTQ